MACMAIKAGAVARLLLVGCGGGIEGIEICSVSPAPQPRLGALISACRHQLRPPARCYH